MEKIREEVMRMIWEAQEKAKNSKNPIGIHKGIYADKIIGLLKRHFSTDLSGFIVEEKCEHEEGREGIKSESEAWKNYRMETIERMGLSAKNHSRIADALETLIEKKGE